MGVWGRKGGKPVKEGEIRERGMREMALSEGKYVGGNSKVRQGRGVHICVYGREREGKLVYGKAKGGEWENGREGEWRGRGQ